MTPDLSVIMPVRDAERFVGDAIASVLAGAEGLLELVVVDNRSRDASAAVAAGFGAPVRVTRLPRGGGPSVARNAGLELARGRLIGFLDSDDLWAAPPPDPRRAALAADPAVGVAMGRCQPVAAAPDGTLRNVLAPYQAGQLGAALFRRGVFEQVGAFDPAADNAEDLDWFLRARHAGVRIERVGDVVLRYRLRNGSITSDRAAVQRATMRSVRSAIERRRRAPL